MVKYSFKKHLNESLKNIKFKKLWDKSLSKKLVQQHQN